MQSPTFRALAVASLITTLSGCTRAPELAGETVLLDETLNLARGASLDSVTREFVAPSKGTCAAIVEEDDGDLVLELRVTSPEAVSGRLPGKVEVESGLYGEGIEVAALDVTRNAKFTLHVFMPPDMATPRSARSRVVCYADESRTPEVRARATAYRAWTAAMPRGSSFSQEAIRKRNESMAIAIKSFESEGRDARMGAWARLSLAVMLHDSMLDLSSALVEMRSAEKAFRGLEPAEPRNVARARYHTALLLTDMLNDATRKNPTPSEAKAEAEQIFTELSRDTSPLSPLQRTRAFRGLGGICFQLGDFKCAIRNFDATAKAVHAIGHRREEVVLLHNLGVTQLDLGNYAESAAYFDQFIDEVDKAYSPVDYASHHYNAGVAFANNGDTARGIKHLLLALESARERESAIDLGRVLFGLGNVYWRRGDTEQAETFFKESLRQRRIATEGSGLILSLTTTGRFARFRGSIDEARELHREALERASTPNMLARARYELALDHAADGDYRHAIGLLRKILEDGDGVAPIRQAITQILLAEYLITHPVGQRSLTEADQLSRQALATALAKSDLVLEASARRVRALLMVAAPAYGDARLAYEEAIAVILDFRGATASPELKAATLDYEQATFREYVDLLMRGTVQRQANAFARATSDEEDALRILEMARSGNLAAVRDMRVDAATQARIDALLQQMAVKRVRIAALNASAMPDDKTNELLQLDMSRLRVEVDQLRGGTVGETRSGKLPPSLGRPWPPVPAGVTQLSYALGERKAYLWVRDVRGLRVAVLAAPPARIERALTKLGALDQALSPDELDRSLAELSALLLPAGALEDAAPALEVVSEGGLGAVPFAALRVGGDGRRVIESHAVRMIPSLFDATAPAAATERAMKFVGIASITGKLRSAGHEFSSLGAARAEARAIAALFAHSNPGQVKVLTSADGDAETLRKYWSGGADVVHFATHGLANLRYPSASLLLLPKSTGRQTAYLTAGEVQEWRGNTDLVFLAACQTAAGPAHFAEGMAGLPRSFLNAGARGVVATLWPVEDLYESEFSVQFYQRFIATRDAESALADTQREWLAARPGERPAERMNRLSTAWAHAFYARSR